VQLADLKEENRPSKSPLSSLIAQVQQFLVLEPKDVDPVDSP